MREIENPDKVPLWCPLLEANIDIPMMCRACDHFKRNEYGRTYCKKADKEEE